MDEERGREQYREGQPEAGGNTRGILKDRGEGAGRRSQKGGYGGAGRMGVKVPFYGLALSGGGARGAAHAGVLLALKEEGLLPGAVAGTSAGSIAAGCFAAGMDPEEIYEAVREAGRRGSYLMDVDYIGLLRFLPQALLHRRISLEGLLKGERLRKWLERLTGEMLLTETSIPLLIPSVDLTGGRTVCFASGFTLPESVLGTAAKEKQNRESEELSAAAARKAQKSLKAGEISERLECRRVKSGSTEGAQEVLWIERGKLGDIMTASCSVPGLFAPRHMEGMLLVDGGVTNNLPSDLLRSCGVETIVAVDIGSAYRVPEGASFPEILTHSFSVMSASLKDCRSEAERLLLVPELPAGAGLLSFDRMEECMEAAYRSTKREAGRIRAAVEGVCTLE